MTMRDILVHCDNSIACSTRINWSLQMGAACDAVVHGYYAIPQISPMLFAEAGGLAMVYEQEEARIAEDQAEVTALFERLSQASK